MSVSQIDQSGAGPVTWDTAVEGTAAWHALKDAAIALQDIQAQDGSVPDTEDHGDARACVETIVESIRMLSPRFPHDVQYLAANAHDFERWADSGFGVPDFYDSLVAFQPQLHREDGIRHLIVFPMYTQNGSRDRHVEALLVEVIWPCLLYTSPSPRDKRQSRMPSSA